MNENGLKICRKYDDLEVKVYENRDYMGKNAAHVASKKMIDLIETQGQVRIIFAAAPSANEFLAELSEIKEIDWSKVTVFHMDEYIGLSKDAPQGFGNFLRRHIFDKVKPGMVNLIDGQAESSKECARYSSLLNEAPIDIVFMGIGENGHIAFNDPPVADFHDPVDMKVVELDPICRQQQVNDGCFTSLENVPTHALTLTIPRLLRASYLYCIVPSERKQDAVKNTLHGAISTACPASILRKQKNCTLYVDADAFGITK